ncbi:MAG: helix-turn-helix transcriptional regulator [Alphaproteobacteria bacterium]|nr:helix-turn-helix transcriptional regulator [Alphaproteobacteria bacterium]
MSGELVESSFATAGRFVCGDLLFRPAYFAHADQASMLGSSYIHVPVSPSAIRAHAWLRGWTAMRGQMPVRKLNLDSLLSSNTAGDRLLEAMSDAAYGVAPTGAPMTLASHRLATGTDAQIVDLSESLELRPYEFTRKFAREFGLPPRAYRRQARLQRAMTLLAEGGSSLAQIATETGHYDQSHLTRNLKQETGLTPLQFRAAAGVR